MPKIGSELGYSNNNKYIKRYKNKRIDHSSMQEDTNPTVGTVSQKISSDLNRLRSMLYSFLGVQGESKCIFCFNPLLIKEFVAADKIRNSADMPRRRNTHDY